jgi:hypothetical protein
MPSLYTSLDLLGLESPVFSVVKVAFIPGVAVVGSPVQSTDSKEKWHIRIKSPKSALRGIYQSLPAEFLHPISTLGQPLSLRLLASELYIPNGIYEVDYIKNGNASSPAAHQLWKIPRPISSDSAQVTRGTGVFDDVGSLPIGEILHISPSGSYDFDGLRIHWLSGGPLAGESYSITYLPALSLRDVIYLP